MMRACGTVDLRSAWRQRLAGKTGGPANVPSALLLAVTPPGGSHFNIMLHLTLLLDLLLLSLSLADASMHGEVPDFYGDEATGYGPVFEEQPVDTIYPEESPEAKITMNCRAKANPPATYKWMLGSKEIDLKEEQSHYSLVGGNLVISYPIKNQHTGMYTCLATNMYGTIISQEASVQFGYLDLFSSEERESVYVKEGQGAVLLCAPPPHYPEELSFRWILNEFPTFIPLDKRRFVSQSTGNLYISKVDSSDSGNYSCIASSPSISKSVFSNYIPLVPLAERPIRKYPADLKVKFPDTTALVGQNITLECFALGKVFIWEDGSLEILNVTRADEGRYTCFAENDRGKANSTGSLLVTESTKITLAPSNADVKVGENAWMQCAASHDPSLDITFIWSLDGRVIDLHKDSQHYERTPNGSSNGELLIKNAQLKLAGRYTCTAQTPVDNVTASAQLVVRAPANVEGNAETATVVDLFPWTEYEFRVIATNTLGTGEPSSPSRKEKTLESVPLVAPSDVGGGGGTSRELIITWTPVQQRYYYGPNFGYIVAFKPSDGNEWRKVTVADPQARRYVHKDSSIPPSTEFQVKVKAFNRKGEGPYSLMALIYSAQDVPSDAPASVDGRALSATEAIVWWLPLSQSNIDGYQVKYWRNQEDSEGGALRVVVPGRENQTRLEGMKPDSLYLIEVRGFNSAGYGPPSKYLQIHTKKAPPSRPPRIIGKKLKGQSVNIAWEHVEPLANEASVDGYKVLYRQQGHSTGTLYTTSRRYIDLPRPANGDYVVEVRAHTEGGDGAVARIHITGGGVLAAQSLSILSLLLVAVLCLNL
eukprot:superscaffoldBa00000784_g7208